MPFKITISAVFVIVLQAIFTTHSSAEQNLKTYQDIVWASPKGFDLTLDIAVPQLADEPLPTLIIFHGGGWLLNKSGKS